MFLIISMHIIWKISPWPILQNLFSYTMQLKLTEVKRLLQSTDITLDDIAWHLGFSNEITSARFLKRTVRCLPVNT